MIVVVGSRAGLLLGIIAAIGAVAIFGQRGRSTDQNEPRGITKGARLLKAYFLVMLVGLTVAVIALYFGRAEAITRLLSTDQSAEERLRILPAVLAMTKDFMPFGTGYGTFEAVFKVVEPENLLSYTVMNRAHNDWLESLLTGGVLAWLLLFWFEYIIFTNSRKLMKQLQSKYGNLKIGLSSLLIMILFGLASLGDYPLRMPSLQCVFVLTLMVFLDAANAPESDPSK